MVTASAGANTNPPLYISTNVDPGADVGIVVSKASAGIPARMKGCLLKAGCITAGEELFRIGRIAPFRRGPEIVEA